MMKLLYPLLFVINDSFFKVEHAFATKTGALLPFCNRAGNISPINTEDINQIKKYFDSMPFRWFIESTDTESIQLLEQNGLEFKIAFPAMKMPLSNIKKVNYDHIEVKEINSSDLSVWIAIVLKSYNIESPEFKKFIEYQVKHAAPDVLHFYLASYKGTIAAASMTITFEDVVSLQWVGTLPEYRNKGLGYAVSHQPLVDAQNRGYNTAVLFASQLGKPVYERLGFEQYAVYNTYGLKEK